MSDTHDSPVLACGLHKDPYSQGPLSVPVLLGVDLSFGQASAWP